MSLLLDRLSRRRVLRGLLAGGAVSVGLPALEIFAGRRARAACASGFPQRFGVFFWGNGNRPGAWVPTGTGPDWEAGPALAALEPWRHKLAVCSNLEVPVPNISPHWSGACALLTGEELVGDDASWTVAGPTLDQRVADAIGGDTIYRSLEIGVVSDRVFSWTGPNAQAVGMTDPFAFYERIFGETFRAPGEGGLVDPRLGHRRSALDAVMGDIASLQAQLGATDRARLEAHLDGVRALESRLARLQEDPPDLAACARPGAPPTSFPDIDGRTDWAARSRALADLLAMALACDQTRVFHFQFAPPLTNMLLPDRSDGHHNLTHNEPGDQPEVQAITESVMESFAHLLGALDAIPEGEGTLLDNCVVLGASEVSEGRTHSLQELPLLVAGGGCGRIAVGQHLRPSASTNANHLSFSLLRALGISVPTYGAGETAVADGLPGIEL